MKGFGFEMRLWKDLKAFSAGSKKKMIVTVLMNPCFHSVCLYRLANLFYRLHLGIIAKIIWYINRIVFCCDIDYRADLAGGFVLVHGLGCVIGKGVKSEGKLRVYQGVTIGGTGKAGVYNDKKITMPVFKDNVIVFTGAKVLGPIVVGSDNRIKAGALVTEDIEDYIK